MPAAAWMPPFPASCDMGYDWSASARACGLKGCSFPDPRSVAEKVVHRILRSTQRRRAGSAVRAFEWLLRRGGW